MNSPTEHTPYTYAIARYMHYPFSGEFVNIGIVAVGMATRQPFIKFRKAYSRARTMFPEFSRRNFRPAINCEVFPRKVTPAVKLQLAPSQSGGLAL